jgi:hypothetical protein
MALNFLSACVLHWIRQFMEHGGKHRSLLLCGFVGRLWLRRFSVGEDGLCAF